jgi:hypothetical protein
MGGEKGKFLTQLKSPIPISERGECGEKNKTNLCSMFAYYRAFGLNQFSLSHRTFGYAGILKKPEHALQV